MKSQRLAHAGIVAARDALDMLELRRLATPNARSKIQALHRTYREGREPTLVTETTSAQ